MSTAERTSSSSSPTSPPYVEVELMRKTLGRRDSELLKKRVYVTEVNDTVTLDLYSGWVLEGEELKFKLHQLPIKVCSFTNLQKLWVSHNNLTELPGQIDQLVNLREIYLHHNAFEAVPLRLLKLTNLEILWLSSNYIASVPPDISSLINLRHLHLEHNKITQYQEALNDLPNLSVLYLNHNHLQTLSYQIHKLSETLRRLYLHYNKLQTVPETICTLEKLEILYLNNNEMNTVPQNFESFCQKLQDENKAIVRVLNNPYLTPRSRVKLSVGGTPPNIQGLQVSISTRRHSDYTGPLGDGINVSRSSRFSVPSGGILPDDREDLKKSAELKKSATMHR